MTGMSLPSTLNMSLHAGRDKHPGAVFAPRAKCSSEEVAAAKAKKEQEKHDKVAKQVIAVKKAAHHEDQMEKDDVEMAQQANHPPKNLEKRQLCVCKEGYELQHKYNKP
jgi:hypothetical protein